MQTYRKRHITNFNSSFSIMHHHHHHQHKRTIVSNTSILPNRAWIRVRVCVFVGRRRTWNGDGCQSQSEHLFTFLFCPFISVGRKSWLKSSIIKIRLSNHFALNIPLIFFCFSAFIFLTWFIQLLRRIASRCLMRSHPLTKVEIGLLFAYYFPHSFHSRSRDFFAVYFYVDFFIQLLPSCARYQWHREQRSTSLVIFYANLWSLRLIKQFLSPFSRYFRRRWCWVYWNSFVSRFGPSQTV